MSSILLLSLLISSAWDNIILAIFGNTPRLLVLHLFLRLPNRLSSLAIFYPFLLLVHTPLDSLLIVLHLLPFSSTSFTSFSLPSSSFSFSADLCARRLRISMQLLPPSTSPDPHYLAAFSPGVTPAFVYSVTPSWPLRWPPVFRGVITCRRILLRGREASLTNGGGIYEWKYSKLRSIRIGKVRSFGAFEHRVERERLWLGQRKCSD